MPRVTRIPPRVAGTRDSSAFPWLDDVAQVSDATARGDAFPALASPLYRIVTVLPVEQA